MIILIRRLTQLRHTDINVRLARLPAEQHAGKGLITCEQISENGSWESFTFGVSTYTITVLLIVQLVHHLSSREKRDSK